MYSVVTVFGRFLAASRQYSVICSMCMPLVGAASIDRADLFRRFVSGHGGSYEMTFTYSTLLPRELEEQVKAAFRRYTEEQGGRLVPRSAGHEVEQYLVRVASGGLLMRRVTGANDLRAPRPDVSHVAVGFVSNAFWTIVEAELCLDYDKAKTYASPSEVMTDMESVDVAPFGLQVVLATHFGVPVYRGTVVWDADRFTVSDGGTLARTRIVGNLVLSNGIPERLLYDILAWNDSVVTNLHTTVVIAYGSDDDVFPSSLTVTEEIRRTGGPPHGIVKHFGDMRVQLLPSHAEAEALSPGLFLREHANVVRVRVVSNSWAYTAFQGGRWIEKPLIYRLGDDPNRRTVQLWTARALILAMGVPCLWAVWCVWRRRGTRPGSG